MPTERSADPEDRPASGASSVFEAPEPGKAMEDDKERRREIEWLIVDAVMLVLIAANLTLIVVDWTFESSFVQRQLEVYVPTVFHWYNDTIHQHFLFYDLAFVAVFVVEILVRWGYAIYQQTYYRWRREYGGLKTDQVKRLKELAKENQRLRQAVSDLALEKLILREAASGNF